MEYIRYAITLLILVLLIVLIWLIRRYATYAYSRQDGQNQRLPYWLKNEGR